MTSKDVKVLEVFARALGPTLREMAARIAALDKTVKHLEQRLYNAENKILSYEGVWTEGKSYDKGAAVTRGGGLWVAKEATSARPGDPDPAARSWVLAVKRGRV